jgi:hypothetical protein
LSNATKVCVCRSFVFACVGVPVSARVCVSVYLCSVCCACLLCVCIYVGVRVWVVGMSVQGEYGCVWVCLSVNCAQMLYPGIFANFRLVLNFRQILCEYRGKTVQDQEALKRRIVPSKRKPDRAKP